ncbi:MAG: hypothetical protein H7A24_03865 [Leptospiraceae bacterium]|nr:hypothetical protein [Leptospiraceae bacterium]MCP5510989.1 hypothetical protein [Leptospiraceae bacterium]
MIVFQHQNPSSQEEVLYYLEFLQKEIYTYFSSIHENEFFSHRNGEWSPAETLMHITITTNLMGFTWKIPSFVLNFFYGKASKRKTFKQWKDSFFKQNGNFDDEGILSPIPLKNVKKLEKQKKKILKKFNQACINLFHDLEKMDPAKYFQLKIPFFHEYGPLSIQESLFLHIFHLTHHHNRVKEKYTVILPNE